MNPTINTIQAHVSCRDFDPSYQLTPEQLNAIIESAKRAPSSNNHQLYSLVILDDRAKKAQFADLVEQKYSLIQANNIRHSSIVIFFLVDFYKIHLGLQENYQPKDLAANLEPILIASTDVTLALQNAALAAESLELGTVTLGVIRRFNQELIHLLNLPHYTFPLLGLAIGKPTKQKAKKPRIDNEVNVFFNQYDSSKVSLAAMDHYSERLNQFYTEQYGQTSGNWFADVLETYQTFDYLSQNTVQILRAQKIVK